MRLLLLDQFSDPGGAQQGLLELLPSMKARGWTATVGLPGAGDLFQKVRDLGFETERIRCGPYGSGSKSLADAARFLSGTPILAAQIRRLVQKSHAQLVFVNGPRILPSVALAGVRVPVVFHSHSFLGPGRVRKLAGMALQRCRAWLIGSCRFVAQPWEPFVPAARRFVIYNGVAGPRELRPFRSRPPVVACIGRIAPEKGQREFVEAALLIRQALPGCRFMVYGAALFAEAGAQQYDSAVRAAGARADVEFPGWVNDIQAVLAQTDLLLVPSMAHEATTRVILEAYAAGVPVVAFRSGGIPEVVEHAGNGCLADSTEAMARLAIELLSLDEEGRAAISRQARDSWTRRFTQERFHSELLSVLERIAAS